MRINAGYSQAQIADFLQVGSSTAFRLEKGMCLPTLAQMIMLCKALDCTPRELYGENNSDTNADIPIFELKDNYVRPLSLQSSALFSQCDFGIVLPYDINERFVTGDICFFMTGTSAHKNDLIISIDEDYRCELCIFDGLKRDGIAAVCKNMRCRI